MLVAAPLPLWPLLGSCVRRTLGYKFWRIENDSVDGDTGLHYKPLFANAAIGCCFGRMHGRRFRGRGRVPLKNYSGRVSMRLSLPKVCGICVAERILRGVYSDTTQLN